MDTVRRTFEIVILTRSEAEPKDLLWLTTRNRPLTAWLLKAHSSMLAAANHFPAHASPSATGPASISFSTVQSEIRIAATFRLASQET
jgi:hypothetical protein